MRRKSYYKSTQDDDRASVVRSVEKATQEQSRPQLAMGALSGMTAISLSIGAVAGTQLRCALDPPRQSEGLRLAYRVPYPNLLLTFLSFSNPS